MPLSLRMRLFLWIVCVRVCFVYFLHNLPGENKALQTSSYMNAQCHRIDIELYYELFHIGVHAVDRM
jgi:hypothetical protein